MVKGTALDFLVPIQWVLGLIWWIRMIHEVTGKHSRISIWETYTILSLCELRHGRDLPPCGADG